MKPGKLRYDSIFSTLLSIDGDAEYDWWQRIEDGGLWDSSGLPTDGVAHTIYEVTSGNTRLSFQIEVLSESVWLYSERKGDPRQVATLVQQFFKSLRPTDPNATFSFSWAETCTHLRPDAFGGGAAVVTRDAIKFWSSWEWCARAC